MKKKIMAALFCMIVIVGYFTYSHNKAESHSIIIAQALENILSGKEVTEIFTDLQLKKLESFRLKFETEHFPTYRIESFQPEDEEIVYLMLIVEPSSQEKTGIVLYMTFELEEARSLKIERIIISNWVTIEYNATQF